MATNLATYPSLNGIPSVSNVYLRRDWWWYLQAEFPSKLQTYGKWSFSGLSEEKRKKNVRIVLILLASLDHSTLLKLRLLCWGAKDSVDKFFCRHVELVGDRAINLLALPSWDAGNWCRIPSLCPLGTTRSTLDGKRRQVLSHASEIRVDDAREEITLRLGFMAERNDYKLITWVHTRTTKGAPYFPACDILRLVPGTTCRCRNLPIAPVDFMARCVIIEQYGPVHRDCEVLKLCHNTGVEKLVLVVPDGKTAIDLMKIIGPSVKGRQKRLQHQPKGLGRPTYQNHPNFSISVHFRQSFPSPDQCSKLSKECEDGFGRRTKIRFHNGGHPLGHVGERTLPKLKKRRVRFRL